MKRSYCIFGCTVDVEFDGSLASSVLADELAVYPSGEASGADVRVKYGVERPVRGLRNPASHTELDRGFRAHYGRVVVDYTFSNSRVTEAAFEIEDDDSSLRRWGRRFANMQYASLGERAGQVFHELVMVPVAHTDPRLILLHASALQHPVGGMVAIGGTGGVGKTSLELELCRKHGYVFAADDIVAVNVDGMVWPNLAYPKIYGYNVGGDGSLRVQLMRGRSILDQFHWTVRSRIDPSGVRRRIAPAQLYGTYCRSPSPLSAYVFISREDRSDVCVESATPDAMAEMSVHVMQSEYAAFYRHLHYHAVNRVLTGRGPAIVLEDLFARWYEQARSVLRGVDCRIVRAPASMPHRVFVEAVVTTINTLSVAPVDRASRAGAHVT